MSRFRDRKQAGEALAKTLRSYKNQKDTLILALPRGGVPVAYEISQKLNIPFDIFLVRKLGVPGNKELAMGAIAQGDVKVFNDEIISSMHINTDAIEKVIANEKNELQYRNQLYRKNRAFLDLKTKTILLVDDGIATGATMKVAIKALKTLGAKSIIIAVPVAAADTLLELECEVDKIYCLATLTPFYAIGAHYDSFPQVSNEEVVGFLSQR